MKRRISAITQVSLAALLALTLGLVTAMPSIAQGSALGSASISPLTEVYDLGNPADVRTTVTWHDAEEITAVEDDDGHELRENDYSVIDLDDDRAILTISASYVADRRLDIGDNLELTIGFDSGDPAVFTIDAVRYPAVSPEEAVYDLDNPPDFVKTSITWGCASSVTNITEGEDALTRGLANDYIVLCNTLLILPDYLDANLKEDGDKLELEIKFDEGDPATFTIVAVETIPTPNPAAYDLFARADMEITIRWHTATKVVSIKDDDDYTLMKDTDYTLDDTIGGKTTLTILDSYLGGKLTEEGDTLVLTIEFDVGHIDFTIKAVYGAPSIAPERADYDLDNPADATTTITWGTATNVTSIVDDDDYTLMKDTDYTLDDTIGGKTTLTILNDYLSDELTDVDQSVELSVRFGFNPGLWHDVTFNITAIGTHPSISPGVAPYDLRSPAAANTTITWRDAEGVVSVVRDGYLLEEDGDYSVTTIDADRATLTILSSYLAGNLTAAGDSVALAIEFDVGEPAAFTITAVDDDPYIDPRAADYDLDNRGNVETVITWQVPIQVVSISENGNPLIMGDHYEVEDITEGETATLTILSDSYLNRKLKDVGDEAVLTIEFSVGNPVAFTIIGVRCPVVDPEGDTYDLDNRADFIETGITWGSASKIQRITERIAEDERVLAPGLSNDYIVLGDTLVITDDYLRRLDIGDVAVLNITFDGDYTARFRIDVEGTDAEICPPPGGAVYDLDDRADVQTTIMWGSATEVVSINETDNDNRSIPENGYNVTQTVDGEATLTIKNAYLEDRFQVWEDKIVLTVEFDVGNDAQLMIKWLAGCFVVTAAYDTAMAQEIEVLREFRDGYLLTNSLGQGLVDLYYRSSPPIAEFIAARPSLKPVVRVGLLPAVAISTAAVNTSPAGKPAVVGSLVLVLVAVAVWTTKRRGQGSTV